MEILVITPYTLKIKDNGTCFDASIVKDSLTFQYSTFKILGKLNCEFHDLLAWYDSNGEYNTRLIIEYEYKGIDGTRQTKELSLPDSVTKWEAGKSYRYTFTIVGDYILFSTPEVNAWSESSGGIIIVA